MKSNSQIKNSKIEDLYKNFCGSILSKDEGIDAEILSELALFSLAKLSIYRKFPLFSKILDNLKKELCFTDSRLQQNIFGCYFKNPIGLAAGFDKNASAAAIWDNFGFGFAELGTVTFHPQAGNQRPRLFRLAKEKAALNRMGFNNIGAKKVKESILSQKLLKPNKRHMTLGLNFGKSKITKLEEAIDDYSASLEILAEEANYVVINISSPNTPGLRELQNTKELRKLISKLKSVRYCPPLLIKIAPDLYDKEIIDIAKLAEIEEISGIIAVNTSIKRLGLEKRVLKQSNLSLEDEKGGLSGDPLCQRANEVINVLYNVNPQMPLVGVGGIRTPKSAWERITSGASLIQLYTGWIYEGPTLVPRILQEFSSQLDKHGFNTITEAVGSKAPWI